MGVEFPDRLVCEDSTTDLTTTDPTLYGIDKLIAENGQISPVESTLHAGDQPGELVPFFKETDELYLSIVPDEFLEFDDLETKENNNLTLAENNDLSTAETNDPTPAETNDPTLVENVDPTSAKNDDPTPAQESHLTTNWSPIPGEVIDQTVALGELPSVVLGELPSVALRELPSVALREIFTRPRVVQGLSMEDIAPEVVNRTVQTEAL